MPSSQFARAIRSIGYKLIDTSPARKCQVIGFTSFKQGDGTATIAAAVALAAASGGMRTLLIDCNPHDRLLTKELAPHAPAGLDQLLDRSADLAEVIHVDPETKLAFLPLTHSADTLPDEVLSSRRLADFVGEMKDRYDLIIAALPPLTHHDDVSLTKGFITGYVAVVRWGWTPIKQLREAVQRQKIAPQQFAAVVINKVKISRLSQYDPEAYTRFAKL